ncbi:SpoIIE family protein phosphatase [Flammeovirga sp. MY04]|uniref:7TM diverse intracellular signaling domain-containing protein n=1 Tax=Flammeovirga sp. MY04 TaxID=1191459 RepID=UPI0009FDE3D5|nr:7TM diverse intracellular signaling domain-containing protein [Flammeovirga sp. MY04]ANQ48744.2 SpoIIE family protein phosphatase [Flammeovirga sp. MY04]
MKLFFKFVMLGILFPMLSFAALQEDVLYLSEQQESVNGAPFIYYYMDQLNEEDFESVSVPSFSKFTPWNSNSNVNFEYGQGSLWAKVDIQNMDEEVSDWLIEVPYAPLDEIEFYLVKNKKLENHFVTGDHVNFDVRPIEHHNYIFPIKLQARESATIYFRVKTDGIVKLPVFFYKPWNYAEVNSKYEVTYGIILGVLLMLCILSVTTYLPTKDFSYLLYPLPLIAKILFTFSLTGHTFQYLFPSFPKMANMITPLSIALWMLGESLFNLYFLKTRKLSKVAFGMNIVGFIFGIATVFTSIFLSYYAAIKLVTTISIPFSIMSLILGFIAYSKGQRIARYYITAWSFYCIGLFVFVGFATGKLPDNFFTEHALDFGDLFLAPLLFLALSKKYAVYREQKNEAIKQMLEMEAKAKEELEEKVVERTAELQEATVELEERQEELETQAAQLLHKNEEITSQAEELKAVNDQMTETNVELEQINEEIAAQRDMMDEKNKELNIVTKNLQDSINYAKRIQSNILPPLEEFKRLFKDFFVMYQPKSTVSGDFYWVAENKKENKVVLVAADCTGHGVPGAMMSVMGGGFLDKIVNLRGVTSPARIIIEMQQNLTHVLGGDNKDSKDGMDLGIIVWDRKAKKVTFAGAHTPLVFVQNKKIYTVKGERLSLGTEINKMVMKEHSIALNSSTSFYLFSDGYQDQFGGENHRKISSKKLKEMILELSEKPMIEQKEAFNVYFENWKNADSLQPEKQTDDVLLLGVKIEA